ncbi:MAG: YbhB/YbcL family Raf kinase inhibitor-like protein [Haliea sp.]|nr:MAG: YbhB/YbcL family Raf kinase inhibitor-like protein [Haliea sp.]
MLEKLPDAIGHALRNQRAGLDEIAFNKSGLRTGLAAIEVRSLAFADHAPIPARYTADAPDGEGLSPPLQWTGVPAGAASLVLMVEDADAPTPRPLVHAIVVDIPPSDGALAEGALTSPGHDGQHMHEGRNSYLMASWLPPDPPPGHGPHRYAFQLFALAAGEPFGATPGRDAVMEAVRERGLASGCLIGTYARPDGSIPADGLQTVGAAGA